MQKLDWQTNGHEGSFYLKNEYSCWVWWKMHFPSHILYICLDIPKMPIVYQKYIIQMVSPLLLEIWCNISKPLTTHELIHVLSLKVWIIYLQRNIFRYNILEIKRHIRNIQIMKKCFFSLGIHEINNFMVITQNIRVMWY